MSLQNATTLATPTISASGGTTVQWASLGSPSSNKLSLYVPADADFRTRRTMDIAVKAPAALATGPNGYSQARTSFLCRIPKLLANGKITVNTLKVEVAYDVESTTADIQALRDLGAQLMFDADFAPAITALALS